MKKVKRNSILTIIAVIVSIISLSLSLVALHKLNSTSGIATVTKWDWNVEISTISDVSNSSNSSVFHVLPTIEDDTIFYGITLGEVDSYGQFNFEIVNLGNIDAKVKSITIKGFELYSDYIDVSIVGVEEGDVIRSSNSNLVKVTTLYRNTFKGKTIKLDDIKIIFVFEEDK